MNVVEDSQEQQELEIGVFFFFFRLLKIFNSNRNLKWYFVDVVEDLQQQQEFEIVFCGRCGRFSTTTGV